MGILKERSSIQQLNLELLLNMGLNIRGTVQSTF